ncbi:MAG TPA: M48 family metallopeptidase [Thiobacillaceae bacterium]|nr:M48 family metallopeptidase [Thiobacillaceae bacterium]
MRRLAAAMLACCVAGSGLVRADETVRPFGGGRDTQHLETEERRVWEQSVDLDEAMRKAGKLNEDAELVAYLQAVANRLFPEFQGELRLHIVRSPFLNAFAVPNGSLYVNEGLIARADNEAQLATVIAHEGAHFTHRHGYRSQQEAKSTTGFALVVAMLGVPLVGDLLALSSITGYSRDMEREADRQGFQRLERAGYDPREAPAVFEHLAREVKASEIKEPFFFSSHPRLEERIESFRELSSGRDGGIVNEAEYLRRTAALRLDVLREELAMGRHRNVLVMLAPENRGKFPPEADYYLAEAYRLRGGEGDTQRAFAAYSSVTARAAGFAPPHRALGVHYLKQGNYGQAIEHFDTYLRLAPTAGDRAYVEQYLAIARSKLKTR